MITDAAAEPTRHPGNMNEYTTPNPGNASKRFVRSRTDRKISGVCGGIAHYFGIDANLVRVLVVLATLLTTGGGLLAYVAAWVIMPEE